MPQPSATAAVEYGLFVPIIGVVECFSGRHSVALYAIVAIHAVACVVAWTGIGIESYVLSAIGFAGCVIGWACTALVVNQNLSRPSIIMVGVSPTSFALAWPLARSPISWHRSVAIVIRLIQVGSVVGILVITELWVLHESWGCYGPSAPARSYTRGMCGTPPGPTNRVGKFGTVCDPPTQYVGEFCKPTISAYSSYGNSISALVHIELLAIAGWILAMVDLSNEVSPRPTAAKAAMVNTSKSLVPLEFI